MPYSAWINRALSNCSGGTEGRPSLAYSLAKLRFSSSSTSRTRPRILRSGCPAGTRDSGDTYENSCAWSRNIPRITPPALHTPPANHASPMSGKRFFSRLLEQRRLEEAHRRHADIVRGEQELAYLRQQSRAAHRAAGDDFQDRI